MKQKEGLKTIWVPANTHKKLRILSAQTGKPIYMVINEFLKGKWPQKKGSEKNGF